ncbi:hypothetical protein BS50DRAFT_572782 [Corynespora cassiicola Philippines]|uniref:Uncharacterized protein n=1 Tax=Corynespora cassiicola Philippines TaxID=1448308 RepID=A0A2T2NQQ3_CORCC|nr:hypothetical protein BS50DRAFT_572782 [Corynespora cassiicola Philippines]
MIASWLQSPHVRVYQRLAAGAFHEALDSFTPQYRQKGTSAKASGRQPQRNWYLGLAEKIGSFKLEDLKPYSKRIDYTKTSLVCSYSIGSDENKVLYIPGAPKRWVNRRLPFAVEQHAWGAARFLWPFDEGLNVQFEAIRSSNPDFDFPSVDIYCASGGVLRNLYQFCDTRLPNRPRRFLLQLIGTTLFIRMAIPSQNSESGLPSNGFGFGVAFERAFTEQDDSMAEDTMHMRTIQYKLGYLNCVVNCEIDAWVSDRDETSFTLPQRGDAVVDLPLQGQYAIERAGRNIEDFSRIVELKSTADGKLRHNKIRDRNLGHAALFFSRVEQKIEGVYSPQHVAFRDIRVTDCQSSRFNEWLDDKSSQHSLRGLVALLNQLRISGLNSKNGLYSIILNRSDDPVEMYEVKLDVEKLDAPGIHEASGFPDSLVHSGYVDLFWRSRSIAYCWDW